MRKLFVSYHNADRSAASWIVRQLRKAGYSVTWDRDFPRGSSFIDEIHRRLLEEDLVVLGVLSLRYLEGPWTRREWQAALAKEAGDGSLGLILVKIGACEPKGLLADNLYIDLTNVSRKKAANELLAGVKSGLGARTHLKPRPSVEEVPQKVFPPTQGGVNHQLEAPAREQHESPNMYARNPASSGFGRGWLSWTIAALLAVGLGFVAQSIRTERLKAVLNPQVVTLSSGPVRGERLFTTVAEDSRFIVMQILLPPDSPPGDYCYQLIGSKGEKCSSGCGLLADAQGVITIGLPSSLLGSGRFSLDLMIKREPAPILLEKYPFQVVEELP